LVKFIKEIWDFFVKKQAEIKDQKEKSLEEEKEDNEIDIALQNIMRIMSHIIAVNILISIDIDTTNRRNESKFKFGDSIGSKCNGIFCI
jgi:hypothetical protein